jgi:enterochelin esterase-like enzyme
LIEKYLMVIATRDRKVLSVFDRRTVANGAVEPGLVVPVRVSIMRNQRSAGEVVTETFDYDGGRQVTVYIPADPPEAVVFAGDGQLMSKGFGVLEAAGVPSTMIVGVHRLANETLRLRGYSPGFDPERFAAHEEFFVGDVRRWARSRFGVALPADRTAVFGVSAGGELALAIGLRHPDVYGAVFCASPGAGYRPPGVMPSPVPRAYLVAGTLEPFFLENATRWAVALRDAGADVVMTERAGSHGGAFWREEFPLMVAWAFGPRSIGGAGTGHCLLVLGRRAARLIPRIPDHGRWSLPTVR